MFRRHIYIVPMVGLLLSLSLTVSAQAEERLEGRELVTALQQGGYVLYFRHASTDRSMPDQSPINYLDRSTQRNLSDKGRRQAQSVGQALHRLGIPVDPQILTSPYCRCVETARLAFGHAMPIAKLAFSIKMTEKQAQKHTDFLQNLLTQEVAAGTNRVIVAHTANLKEATNVWPKPEGVIVILHPSPNKTLSVLGMVKVEEWTTLAERYGQAKTTVKVTPPLAKSAPYPDSVAVQCNEDVLVGAQDLLAVP